MDAVLQPDGYDFPGTFYTDAAGNPQMLGPIVESFEGDHINFKIANMNMMGASTHCEWNDGVASVCSDDYATPLTSNRR